ncbi:MAG: hypothetical protein JNM80_07255 [Phycisphaerae bacterium]|nr:hypothetical protein [Phycisphaerae bacterium]
MNPDPERIDPALADDTHRFAAWFAGPKAENGEWFAETLRRIVQDYHSWRRNYFPEDGIILDSSLRREGEPFRDAFDDRLMELLARLKADFPFHSPRYAAHMVAEQTLPSIAGYFAAMLYNPNNISAEAAPVTIRLELEAAQLIAHMLGYGPDSWAHLTSGGTLANLEALWIARSVCYLPLVVRDMRAALDLPPLPWPDEPRALLRLAPSAALAALARTFDDAHLASGRSAATTRRVIRAYLDSPHNVVEHGLASVCGVLGLSPVLLVPESHHYCFEKALDALGVGRRALRAVRVDADFRMDVRDLERRLDEVEPRAEHVLAVVAVVGSTEEGAIDPVDRVLDLRSRRESAGHGSFWLHADAAYGGYLASITRPHRLGLGEPRTHVRLGGQSRALALTLPEHSACAALERLGECDSITIDPHKLGYIPYPAGAVCFRSNLVKPIARQDAPYIDAAPGDAQAERTSQSIGLYALEGSKPGAAAAAVWLSHSLIPLDATGHGLLVRETIRNACELHALLEAFPSLAPPRSVRAVSLCAPGSNIVCYAFRPAAGDASLAKINSLNQRLHERFTLKEGAGGERVYNQSFFVSRTTLAAGRYGVSTVAPFLGRLGVGHQDYEREGVFLLRSTLMNPWYEHAKRRGRHFLAELVEALYAAAEHEWARLAM